MRNNIISFENYTPVQDEPVLLDTNILIDLFYPLDFSPKTHPCEVLYTNLINKKSNLLISSTQISEFINKCIRLQFEYYKKNNNLTSYTFKKDYRNTEDFKNNMNAILDIVTTDIIKDFKLISDNFDLMNTDNLFKYNFSYDFNDALISEIARLNNATLITNDGDFINHLDGLKKIVTQNKLLLNCH